MECGCGAKKGILGIVMKQIMRRVLPAVLLATVMGCSTSGGNTAPATDKAVQGNTASTGSRANAITVRFNQYVDQRNVSNPRFLGEIRARVFGVSGSELILDEDIAAMATASMKNRFEAEGFQVRDTGGADGALFEVSGVIRELSLHVRNRDEISIAIETTLKDAATGAVVWSGLVTEKNDRFAGVGGNNKADLVSYLNKGLGIVSARTAEAVSASLAAARPELFNLTPGTSQVKGVDVYVAPSAASGFAAPALPVTAPGQPGGFSASSANGLLVVTTNPPRAKVYLDGVYFGLSPLRFEVEPGIRDVVVKLKGYKTATEKVSVRKGSSTELELNLDQ